MKNQLIHSSEKYLISYLIGLIFLNISCVKDQNLEITINKPRGNLDPGVALTFDDAYFDDWIQMLPIFEKYNAKVTFFISLNYPYKDSNDKEKILKLYKAGNEIAIHTLNHPHLSAYLKHRSLSYYYNNEILPEIRFFNSLGIKPVSFAYPYGEHNEESDSFLSQYFNKIRHMWGSPNIKRRGESIIGASLIVSSNLKDYEDEILYAKADSNIWVLVEHKPVQKVTSDDTFTFATLDSICKFISEHNMRFYCLGEIDTLNSGDTNLK